MTEEDYIKKQIELNSNIRCENTVNLSQVQTVAGVDLAYWKSMITIVSSEYSKSG